MVRFGPAGNEQRFYDQGHKHTVDAPAWLSGQGLNAFEYSFGRGVNIQEESARKVGEAMAAHGIALSGHAPYFINLCDETPEKKENNRRWLCDSARTVDFMGGRRVVFHPGAVGQMDRPEALRAALRQLREVMAYLDDQGLAHITLCPETLGKKGQFGHLAEVLALCEADERLIPCIDFAHLHALRGGALSSPEAFEAVIAQAQGALGERMRCFHVHFSRIEYTSAGEKRHMTFADEAFGPDFCHLAPLVKGRGWTPTFICECKNTQATDACAMRAIWESA